MAENYIGAGLDPERFWEVSPRLMMTELRGAAKRLERERGLVWWGAMMPRMKTPPGFKEFVRPSERLKRQPPDVLDAMCVALAVAWGAEQVIH